jgi:hypothetical protein
MEDIVDLPSRRKPQPEHPGEMTCAISNGTSCQGASFLEGYWSLRLCPSSHTLPPTFHRWNLDEIHFLMVLCAFLCAVRASFRALPPTPTVWIPGWGETSFRLEDRSGVHIRGPGKRGTF